MGLHFPVEGGGRGGWHSAELGWGARSFIQSHPPLAQALQASAGARHSGPRFPGAHCLGQRQTLLWQRRPYFLVPCPTHCSKHLSFLNHPAQLRQPQFSFTHTIGQRQRSQAALPRSHTQRPGLKPGPWAPSTHLTAPHTARPSCTVLSASTAQQAKQQQARFQMRWSGRAAWRG